MFFVRFSVAVAASRRAECGGAHAAVVFASQKLRCDARGSVAPRNSLHCASLHSAQTAAASMCTLRAARANTPPCASRHRRNRPAALRPPRSRRVALQRWRANTVTAKLRLRAHRPGGASVTLSSAAVSVGALQRASCSDSPQLFERSAQRVASSAVRPNPEQRREVAKGDRSSEALSAARSPTQLCRETDRKSFKAAPFHPHRSRTRRPPRRRCPTAPQTHAPRAPSPCPAPPRSGPAPGLRR